jgi:hypothetical protein
MKQRVESKDITEVMRNAGVDWSAGCGKCRCGYLSAPELTRAADLWVERLVQHIDGEITYCDCRAGQAAQKHCGNRWEALLREARTDANMSAYSEKYSHPEIEIARDAIHKARRLALVPKPEPEEEFPSPPPMRFEPSAAVVIDDDDDDFPAPKPLRAREGVTE